jgi:hypothetical protein
MDFLWTGTGHSCGYRYFIDRCRSGCPQRIFQNSFPLTYAVCSFAVSSQDGLKFHLPIYLNNKFSLDPFKFDSIFVAGDTHIIR